MLSFSNLLPYQRQDPFGILYFSPFPRHKEAKPGTQEAASGQIEETSYNRQRTAVCARSLSLSLKSQATV